MERDVEKPTTKLRKIAEKLVEKAVGGDIVAIKEVADRLDGKAHQSSDIEHKGGLAELMEEIALQNNRLGGPRGGDGMMAGDAKRH